MHYFTFQQAEKVRTSTLHLIGDELNFADTRYTLTKIEIRQVNGYSTVWFHLGNLMDVAFAIEYNTFVTFNPQYKYFGD